MGAGLSKNRIKGLSASVDQNSAVLILGTLPGRMVTDLMANTTPTPPINSGTYYS